LILQEHLAIRNIVADLNGTIIFKMCNFGHIWVHSYSIFILWWLLQRLPVS